MKVLLDLQGCQALGSRNRGIGRYSLALAKEMVRQGTGHEFWLLLNAAFPEAIESLREEFSGLVPASRFAVFQVPRECADLAHEDLWRARAAELIRRHAIRELHPDVVHVGSLFEGLVEDCATAIDPELDGAPTAVTLYDLIPLLNPQRYLADARTANWYHRKIESLVRADLLLGISSSACQEAESALTGKRGRVVDISSAADPALFHPAAPGDAASRLGLKRGFIMYTGGIDWRKNIDGLIRAYAMLPGTVRAEHQLALVCHAETYARTQLLAAASRQGLAPDDVVFTGYVTDADLADLYRSCTLFVFPSLHEGFGLPALEAMMCGAVVIGSNNSSIPEVIGRDDALFDPGSDKDISALMLRALEDEPFRQALREHAPVQAARFSWQQTAGRAVRALEELHAANLEHRASRPPDALPRRLRLAMHAPLPPAQSGIADYTAQVLEVLHPHYDIELITDQPDVQLPGPLAQLPVRTTAWFREHAGGYDRIVYQFGNSVFHAHMFGLLKEFPGVVVLHDFFLSGVLNWMEMLGHEPGTFERALRNSHGPKAVEEDRRAGRDAAVLHYPCNRDVVQRATGVIVHSRYSLEAGDRWYGPGFTRKWRQIPLLRIPPSQPERESARRALGLAPDDFLVCTFGHVAPTKLSVRALQAWQASTLAGDSRCRFVMVGNSKPPYDDDVQKAIRQGPGASRISITGFADAALYERYLCAADLAVQLRTMSRGETSAAVLDCLGYGLPLVANANGASAEYPTTVLRLLPDEFSEAELVQALEQLRADGAQRQRLSAAAREWVQARHTPQAVGPLYRAAIEEFAARPPNASYWDTVHAIAALADSPADSDLTEAAVALAATAAAFAGTTDDRTAPSGAR